MQPIGASIPEAFQVVAMKRSVLLHAEPSYQASHQLPQGSYLRLRAMSLHDPTDGRGNAISIINTLQRL